MSNYATSRCRSGLRSLLLAILPSVLGHASLIAQSPFPAMPDATTTRAQDRDQMLWQLGITPPTLPPKNQDPNAPANARPVDPDNPEGNWTDDEGHTITRSEFGLWTNYDDRAGAFEPGLESWRVGDYTPIDLLRLKDGTPVRTPNDWWTKRRPEIAKDVMEQVWGVIPENTPKVTFSAVASQGTSYGVAYRQQGLTGAIDISSYPEVRNVPSVSATLRIPATATAESPVPVLIVIGGLMDDLSGNWPPEFGGGPFFFPGVWSTVASSGWAVCTFNPTALQPDSGGANLSSYIIGLMNKGQWRKPTDWGTLAAWSWGISRLVDYLAKVPGVDASKIGVQGHSRYGKAALVAMAYEPRLAVAYPSEAGSLGAKMIRRHWGQDLENSGWDQEYHWVAGNFFKWMGPLQTGNYMPRRVELMPVDAHSLLSLCAPRPVFLNGGTQDSWSDAYGTYLTAVGADPVYELLGGEGLDMTDGLPQVNAAYISGELGYRYHEGGHTDALDYPAFIDFANAQFARTSRLSALSVRANAGRDDQTLILGLAIGGTGGEQVLVRAVGPGLADHGVVDALDDPTLQVYNSVATRIAQNDDWSSDWTRATALRSAFTRFGAAALTDGSMDAVVFEPLAAGTYTAHVTTESAETGTVLAEAFSEDLSGTARLVSVSARAQSGTGEETLIAGLVIAGDKPKTVLIRGVGPSLVQHGVSAQSVLIDPRLALFRGSTQIDTNDDWGGVALLKQAFAKVGLAALASDTSKDAVLMETLPPGVYTVHVNGANGGSGVALIEVYEVP